MAAFAAESWYCGKNAARSGREYHHILLLHSVEFIRVDYTETLLSFSSWNLTDRLLSRTLCTNLVLFPKIAEVQSELCSVL